MEGVRLHFLERGEGPPLVLLHGNGAMVQDFEISGILERLAQRYRVIAVDRPGCPPLRSPGAWQPGRPIRTQQDEAEWQVWRRERILTAQRDRRAGMRRIDHYASPEADAIIDQLRTLRAGGDASSILEPDRQ